MSIRACVTVVTVATVAIALLALVPFAPPASSAGGLVVNGLKLSPDPPIYGETFEVSCRLADETGVKAVFLFYCSDLNCFPPIAMTRDVDGTYRATSHAIDSKGTHHYNITITYTNDTRAWTYDGQFTPSEKPPNALEVELLSIKPAVPRAGEKVDVYCRAKDAPNVSSMRLTVVVGTSSTPYDMVRLGNGTYHAQVGPFDEGQQVRYNVTATMTGGGQMWTGDLSFTPGKKAAKDDDGFIPTVGAATVLAVLAGLAVSRRGRRTLP